MASEVLAEAFVRLRSLNDGSFEREARDSILPVVGRIAGDAARVATAAKIFSFAKDGVAELGEAEKALAVTESHIKSTGGAAGVTKDQIVGLSESLADLSGTDDEVIQQGENMLLTFTKIRNEVGEGNDVFDRATKAALDLSISGFGSMGGASVMLGKALNDPIAGMTALGKAGVTFTDDQKTMVKQLVETGDTLGAQKLILEEVEKQVGGTAAAFGETLPGKLARAQNSMDEAKAAMVGGLAPALEYGADAVAFLTQQVAGLPEPLQAIVGITALVGGGIASMIRPISDLVGLYRAWQVAQAATIVTTEAATAAIATQAAAEAALAGNTAASVASLYAQDTALAASGSAFGIWGVVAAGAIIAVSTAMDIWGSKTTHNFSEIQKYASETGDELVQTFEFYRNEGNVEDINKLYDALVNGGAAGVGALQRLHDSLQTQGKDTTEVDAALARAISSQRQFNSATAEGSAIIDGSTASLDAAAKAADSYAGFVDALAGAMDKQYEATLSATQLHSSYEAGIDDLTESLRKNGVTLDDSTDKGRANIAATLTAGESIAKLIEAKFAETHSMEDATNAGAMYVAGLRKQLEQAGYNEEQVQSLIETMHLTPEEIRTTFSTNGVEAQAIVQRYKESFKDIPPDVRTELAVLIDQGKLTEANFILDLLSQPRTVQFSVQMAKSAFAEMHQFDAIPQRAGGGPVSAGQVFEGAEQGYEYFKMATSGLYRAPADGTVLNHADSQRLEASMGPPGAGVGHSVGPLTIIVPLSVDGREFARTTVRYTAEELRSYEMARR